MKRIAINGMGRIGRTALKILVNKPNLKIVGVNDIAPIADIAYLLKYDSVQGAYEGTVNVEDGMLIIDDQAIPFYNQQDPEQLPWKALEVDVVIESTGIFTNEEEAVKHITAGAKTVLLSGPTKSPNFPTVVHGVNSEEGKTSIFSCASCTTNNISPVMEIIGRRIGIEKAIMTTIHANTINNSTVDGINKKDPRMGRSGLNNLIPTTTGAAIATTKALPEYEGKFDGLAVRVPIAVGSLSDITIVASKETSVEEVNAILTEEADTARYKDVFAVTQEPLVSSDIIKSPYAAIADLKMTKVVDGDLIKILTWYDNEWGFTHQMIRQIESI